MNINTIIIELVIFLILFCGLTSLMLYINPLSFISDYPPEIQDRYYKSQHKEVSKEKLTTIMKIKKAISLIVFFFIFAWMFHIAGATTFTQGVLLTYIFLFAWFSFDTFFMDWVLFSNIKRFRLPGTENMDKEYHQKWFHVRACAPMVPIGLITGPIVAFIMITIF